MARRTCSQSPEVETTSTRSPEVIPPTTAWEIPAPLRRFSPAVTRCVPESEDEASDSSAGALWPVEPSVEPSVSAGSEAPEPSLLDDPPDSESLDELEDEDELDPVDEPDDEDELPLDDDESSEDEGCPAAESGTSR